MNPGNNDAIKSFWNDNPVGSNFVSYRQDKSFYISYDEFRYKTEKHILEELNSIDFKNKTVLEIGLGQGADSMQIIDRGAEYYGIDLTEESVRRVKERFELFQKKYVDVRIADAKTIPFDSDSFDIVYSHGVIHHSPKIEVIIEEIFRILKPGGKAIIMLYHKASFNYYVSICVMRRLGLLLLLPFPFLAKVISKVTGENIKRINKHKYNLKKQGISYLKMENFIHRSTDGPDNIYASVWTSKSAKSLFQKFGKVSTNVHFLNERHLLGLQFLLPKFLKNVIARKYGWHLWIKATK